MRLEYTENFTLTTSETLIQKGDTPGDGVIPNDRHITGLVLELVTATDQIEVRGIDERSEYITLPAGVGCNMERITNEDRLLFYVKAHSGSVSVNLWVEGDDK